MADETTKAQTAKPHGDTVFGKIVRKEIPTELLYEDDKCIVINSNNPKAPVHMILIPKKPIPGISSAEDDDEQLLGHLLLVGKKMATQRNLDEGGYRLVMNNGPDGQQSVFHLHIHLMGGRQMKWPPG